MFVLRVKMYLLLAAFTAAGIFSFTQSHAQLYGQALIDSQVKQVLKQKEDTNKVNLLLDISFNCYLFSTDEGIKYAQQALALAIKIKWRKGIGDAHKIIGVNYMGKSDYAKALEHYGTAEKIFREIGYKRGIITVSQNTGLGYYYQSDYTGALKYFSIALNGYKETGDKRGIAQVLQNMGLVYECLGNYSKALQNYMEAAKLYEETGDKYGMAGCIHLTGNIYYYQKDFLKALEYYNRALKIYEDLGSKSGIAGATSGIGNVYSGLKDYPKALEYDFIALKIYEEIGDKKGAALKISNIGLTYSYQKNYTMALCYEYKAMLLFQEIGDRRDNGYALRDIGNVYLALAEDTNTVASKINTNVEMPEGAYLPDGQIPAGKAARLRLAQRYLQQALDTAKNVMTLALMQDCYESLAKVYRLNDDYRKAMESYERFIAIKDSVFSKDNQKKIVQQQMQHDFDVKEKLARAEQDKKDTVQKNIRNSTIVGMMGLLVFTLFAYRQRNRVIKEKANVEKEKARSEELLLNILPTEVAEELKTTGGAKARHFDNVTVLFTDFVNFTQASEKMHPQALIDELHACFKAFDEITAKYNIEKIKTIGDAYLAVAGLPEPDTKHAGNVINAAVEICSFMETRYARLGNETFQVRVGVHSGSVVAGIVGVRKFAYDVWGDTVNTAARMEQNSEAGKVNISEATYELVKDEFKCTFRGTIEAKNKGMLKMYYVIGATA